MSASSPMLRAGGDSVVGVPLQLVDQILAGVVRLGVAAVANVDQPDVVVTVDQAGHHRLAR